MSRKTGAVRRTETRSPSAAPAPMPVLVVDDSFLMRRVLRGIIESDPAFRVAGEAADGQEALARVAELQPELILLDIEMPRMDGIEFLRRARQLTAARIVVISSIAQPGTAQALMALDLGAHDIMPKPSGVLSTDMAASRSGELLATLRAVGGLSP
ncbi:MAG: response regulator [Pseudomonadota bacterium]